MSHSFTIVNADTDSISFCKPDHTSITAEERKALIKDINSISPEFMIWGDDGLYFNFIVLAAKNYIMKDEKGKVKLKGSSIRDAKIKPAIKAFNLEIIDSLLAGRQDFVDIYTKYVLLVENVTDIRPWCKKLTISKKTLTGTRENEAKPRRAIEGSDYREGDKIYVFYDTNQELVLIENYKGSYDKVKLYQDLYNATKKFASVIDRDQFLNFKLVKNQNILRELQGLPPIIKEPKKKKA